MAINFLVSLPTGQAASSSPCFTGRCGDQLEILARVEARNCCDIEAINKHCADLAAECQAEFPFPFHLFFQKAKWGDKASMWNEKKQ